jgi:hypothetical protein
MSPERPDEGRGLRFAAHVQEKKGVYTVLVGNAEITTPLGRPHRKWKYNFKMDLKEIRWEGVVWIHLAHDGNQQQVIVNTIMSLRVHSLPLPRT